MSDLPPREYGNIPWLTDEQHQEAIGRVEFQLTKIMGLYNIQGLGIFIPGTIKEIIRVCEDYALVVRGVDHPIEVEPGRRSLY